MKKGGICASSCYYYDEVILDSHGGTVADYVEGCVGVINSCCLGHELREGSYCEDYE